MDWAEAVAAGIWPAVEDELSQVAAAAAGRCSKSCAETADWADDNCLVVVEES